ncbi:helix-turn-helix domain-containing protein [Methylobacterium sp. J-043]|nr:helix-turn-helix domain-containing protein [Methylobacterium sp. J-043]
MTAAGSSPNRIAKLREAQGLSQRELAKLADMHWLTLSHLETGKSKLTAKRISQLASALKVSVSYLLTEVKTEIPEDDKSIHGRLRMARIAAGYAAVTLVTRKFEWKEAYYRQQENGKRNISLEELKAYAVAFEADPAWIAFGAGIHPDGKNDIYPSKGDIFLVELSNSKTVGSRIAAYRRYMNITQSNLANNLKVSQTTISKWENELSPPADSLPEIAAALNIGVLDLLGLGTDPESSLTTCLGPAHTEAFQLLHGGTVEMIGAGTVERERARHTIIILAERLKLEAARGLC